jgi:hypothetical protein
MRNNTNVRRLDSVKDQVSRSVSAAAAAKPIISPNKRGADTSNFEAVLSATLGV